MSEVEYEERVAEANRGSAPEDPLLGRAPGEISLIDYKQWVIAGNSSFRPTGKTVSSLPPATYRFDADDKGVFILKVNVVTDNLIVLPGSVEEVLLPKMEKFWESRDKYTARGLLYKKGALLYGPPGGGKTSSIQLLMRQLIDIGGIVVICHHPVLAVNGLQMIRRIEPERKIICVYEDIDEMIARYGEHELLAILDGEAQVDNVFNVATTNYIDRLEARIANRPGRFDVRIFVDMPNADARLYYLRKIAPELSNESLAQWIEDTEGFGTAHLRELASSVFCLDEDYKETVERLRELGVKAKYKDSMQEADTGFVKKDRKMSARTRQIVDDLIHPPLGGGPTG